MDPDPDQASVDADVDLVVDGNAAAGALAAIFGIDLTAHPGQCAHCGTVSLVGTLRGYVRCPGIILRCPVCAEVVVRIVETPRGTMLDARGAAYLVLQHPEPL